MLKDIMLTTENNPALEHSNNSSKVFLLLFYISGVPLHYAKWGKANYIFNKPAQLTVSSSGWNTVLSPSSCVPSSASMQSMFQNFCLGKITKNPSAVGLPNNVPLFYMNNNFSFIQYLIPHCCKFRQFLFPLQGFTQTHWHTIWAFWHGCRL